MNSSIVVRYVVGMVSELLAEIIVSSQQRPDLEGYRYYAEMALFDALVRRGYSAATVAGMFGAHERTFRRHRATAGDFFGSMPREFNNNILTFLDKGWVDLDDIVARFVPPSGDSAPLLCWMDEMLAARVLEERMASRRQRQVRLAQPGSGEVDAAQSNETLKALIRWTIFDDGAIRQDDLHTRFFPFIGRATFLRALGELQAEEAVCVEEGVCRAEVWFTSRDEPRQVRTVAMLDHLKSVIRSMQLKLDTRRSGALPRELLGGSTFSFDLWPGHELAPVLLAWLSRGRDEIGPLWERAEALRDAQLADQAPDSIYKLILYFGQGFSGPGFSRLGESPPQADAACEEPET